MNNRKALTERRDELKAKMAALLAAAETETRAMSAEESAAFDAAEAEIRAIDETLERENRARAPYGSESGSPLCPRNGDCPEKLQKAKENHRFPAGKRWFYGCGRRT